MIDRSAAGVITEVLWVAVLLSGLKSGGLSTWTLTVFVISPPSLGMIRMSVVVAKRPMPRSPMSQVTVPPNSLQGPWAMAETKVTPGGSVSMRVTPVATEGPLFLMLILLVRISPTNTGSGKSVLVTEMSADGTTTVVVCVAVLLLKLGSGGLLATTVAVLVISPVEVGMIRMTVLVVIAPRSKSPMLQVTMPPSSLQPPGDVAEMNVTPGGSVSVRVTAVDDEGPLLNTSMR